MLERKVRQSLLEVKEQKERDLIKENLVRQRLSMLVEHIQSEDEFNGLSKNEKIDLIIGGPPCQAFSTAGKRLSINENRGIVFIKFLNLII